MINAPVMEPILYFTAGAALGTIGTFCINVFNAARASRRQFKIETKEVHREYAAVHGSGAKANSVILVMHLTNRWYLQEGAPVADARGQWIHTKCHFDNSAIGVDRIVFALAVSGQEQVDAMRDAFGDWGSTGNKNNVKPEEIENILKARLSTYNKSEPTYIRRVP